MAKISDLPLIAEPVGDETVVVLKEGETKRAGILGLVTAALATVSAAAIAAVNAAKEVAIDAINPLVTSAETAATTAETIAAGISFGVTGAITSNAYDTPATQREINSFSVATATAEYAYVTQALVTAVPPGGKLTVFSLYDDLSIAPAARCGLFRGGTGIVSATPALAIDGSINAVVLMNTHATLPATSLSFDTNGIASYGVTYIAVAGDMTATAQSTAFAGLLMATVNLMRRRPQKDAVLRAQAMPLSGPPVNASLSTFTANGFGDVSFTADGAALRSCYQPMTSVAEGGTVLLLYRCIGNTGPAATGTAQVFIDSSGSGAASAITPLNRDGGVHVLPLTILPGKTGRRLQFYCPNVTADMRVQYAMLQGDPASTTPVLNALQGGLLAFANLVGLDLVALRGLVSSAITETWTATEAQPLFPKHFFAVSGRPVTLHGPTMLRGRKEAHRVRVALLNKTADDNGSTVGVFGHLNPVFTFDPASLKSNGFTIATRWGNDRSKLNYKPVTHHVAPAALTGKTAHIVVLGDSLSGNLAVRLKEDIADIGATVIMHGSKTIASVPYEGVAGSSLRNWIGNKRSFANEFLRAATAGDFAANPRLCFADDDPAFNSGAGYAPGAGSRTSYFDDLAAGALKASYSIFDFEAWRLARVAAGDTLPANTKLIFVLELGVNDFSVADQALFGAYIVANFRAAFANGATVIGYSAPLSGTAAGTATGDGDDKWVTNWEPAIREWLRQFDNDAAYAQRISIAPGWATQDPFFSWAVGATVTDPETGVITGDLTDYIHATGFGPHSHAEAFVGPVAWWANTL